MDKKKWGYSSGEAAVFDGMALEMGCLSGTFHGLSIAEHICEHRPTSQ
jgi:hypothetical protein